MKQFIISLSVMTLIACSSAPQQSIFDLNEVQKGPVILKINNQEIHQGFLDLLVKLNPRIRMQLSNPLTRKKILNSLVDQQLLFNEALKKGVDKKDDIVAKMLLNKHVIISNALIEDQLDAQMKEEYEKRKKDQFTKLDVSLIGIYFDPKSAKPGKITDEQKKAALKRANAVVSRLKKGDKFEQVAKENSDDKMTKKKGGKAGQIAKNDRRFARLGLQKVTETAFNLKKDKFSAPIETKKGYFIVKVNSDEEVVPFEEAQRALRFELQNKIKKDLVDKLRKTAKIEFINKGKTSQAVKTDKKAPQPKTKPKKTGHEGHAH